MLNVENSTILFWQTSASTKGFALWGQIHWSVNSLNDSDVTISSSLRPSRLKHSTQYSPPLFHEIESRFTSHILMKIRRNTLMDCDARLKVSLLFEKCDFLSERSWRQLLPEESERKLHFLFSWWKIQDPKSAWLENEHIGEGKYTCIILLILVFDWAQKRSLAREGKNLHRFTKQKID